MAASGSARGDAIFVATDDVGQVVGFILVGLCRDDPTYQGEVKVITVSPAAQGQGIGRQLVQRGITHLAHRDVHSFLVRVITTNPYRAFYVHLGGQFLREEPYDWNGVAMAEAVYGWGDTGPLLADEG